MKKVIVVGVGAQGSTIAKRLNDHPGVSEIICADYDQKAAEALLAEHVSRGGMVILTSHHPVSLDFGHVKCIHLKP